MYHTESKLKALILPGRFRNPLPAAAMVRPPIAGAGHPREAVLAAMNRVPRERLCLEPPGRATPIPTTPCPIDCGQTISQPVIVALMTEALELTGSERVLEIGTGSGYQTAILAELAAAVFSIERHADLAARPGAAAQSWAIGIAASG